MHPYPLSKRDFLLQRLGVIASVAFSGQHSGALAAGNQGQVQPPTQGGQCPVTVGHRV